MTTENLMSLINLTPVKNLADLPIRKTVVQEVKKALWVDKTITQCVYVSADDTHWGICLGTSAPPVVFVVSNTDEVTVLGFTPHLCGPIVRMSVDGESIYIVVSAPEGDELFYRISKRDLSFDNPRGEVVTDAHKELLYATH